MSYIGIGYHSRQLPLIVALAVSLSASALAQDKSKITGATALQPGTTYKVGTTGPAGGARVQGQAVTRAEKRVSVIVKLSDKSLAAYKGGVGGMAATSPAATGAPSLDVNSSASQQYLAYLNQRQSAFTAAATAISSAEVVQRFDIVLGGVSMVVPETQLDAVRALPGVEAVYLDSLLQLDTNVSPQFIGAPTIWKALGGQDKAGEGVVVGVLDSGVWPEHPSYADNGYPPPPSTWHGTACEFGNTAFNPMDASFTCNNKLLGAKAFLETYKLVVGLLPTEFDSARDDNGHGTHTSTTAAGNAGVDASIFGVHRGTISGIAPRASVAAYKVCGDQGCFQSDTVAAVQQAITDGVDVINFSISGGGSPYADVVELAFLDAYEAGVFVAASAGNSGPAAETVDHRGPWVTTVGASTTNRHFLSEVTLHAQGGATLKLIGASITEGISVPTPVVQAKDSDPSGDNLCLQEFPAGTFSGQIVVCQVGVNTRIEKGFNVLQGGAGGMLIYNPTLQGIGTDNHHLPAVMLEVDKGQQLLGLPGGEQRRHRDLHRWRGRTG
jgi:Subtilase family/PA domain/Peptidase inhibitor I9